MSQSVPVSFRAERDVRIREKLVRELGPEICAFLADPSVVEIMLNADGALWVERVGHGVVRFGSMGASQAEALMATIAAAKRTTIAHDNPILECELTLDGSRFEGLLPPVALAPVFAIRRRPGTIFTLADYVAAHIMTGRQREIIAAVIEARRNILIVGGTGTGKTTLVNAVIDHLSKACPADRLLILEDTAEIQCASANAVMLRTSDTIDLRRLLRATMRLRPDRILVGEVRKPSIF